MKNLIFTENMQKANNKLAKFTDKPIKIGSLAELSKERGIASIKDYYGASFESDEEFWVFLNEEYSEAQESTYVHELLHMVLKYEGYPRVKKNDLILHPTAIPMSYLEIVHRQSEFLSSAIEHPEIFRRMTNEFNLDMNQYFKAEVELKSTRYKKGVEVESNVFLIQQSILDGHEYFYYNELNSTIMREILKKNSIRAYNVCLGLSNQTKKIGFNSPIRAFNSSKEILNRIIKFGEKNINLDQNGFDLNLIWKCFDILPPAEKLKSKC